jgi:hypothetical protein
MALSVRPAHEPEGGNHMNTNNQSAPLPTETVIKLIASWVFVGIPLVFGVIYTLINAMKLFQ